MLRKRAGFTLTEILIGLSVIGILAALSAPSFNTLIQNYRVTSSADYLYEFLQQARSEAIKRNVNIYISFSTGDSWCAGMNTNSACDCTVSGACDLSVIRAEAAQQATLSVSGYTGNTFYYSGAHGMASTAGTMTLTRYGSSELITLAAGRMGSVKMCSTGIGGYTAC